MKRIFLLGVLVWGCGTVATNTQSDTQNAPDQQAPLADQSTVTDPGLENDPGPEATIDASPIPEWPAAEPFNFTATRPWFSCTNEGFPPEVITVKAHDKVHQYFGGENLRSVDTEVTFPEGKWAQIGLKFELECPPGGLCDHWDRSGSVQMLLNDSEDAGHSKYVELTRHITPYRIEMCQYIDISELAPLLKGTKTINSWIDTWVGPGHANGDGWQVSVTFAFYPGESDLPDEVINVWGRRSITVGEIEPESSVGAQTEPFTFTLPDNYSKVVAHLTTTGHSFGNTYNCAEFCEMRQDILLNESVFSVNPWRSDCDKNPVSPQYGTWEHPRNGWCPGAISIGNRIDVTSGVQPGNNILDFDILLASGSVYDNTQPVDLLPHEYVSLKLYVYH